VNTTIRTHRCPKCGEEALVNEQNFYLDRDGRVTGYCRFNGCHRAYNRAYWAAGRDPHPERKRDWYRRSHGVPRERYLVRGRRPEEEAS
jgi:hypothetical protein